MQRILENIHYLRHYNLEPVGVHMSEQALRELKDETNLGLSEEEGLLRVSGLKVYVDHPENETGTIRFEVEAKF